MLAKSFMARDLARRGWRLNPSEPIAEPNRYFVEVLPCWTHCQRGDASADCDMRFLRILLAGFISYKVEGLLR